MFTARDAEQLRAGLAAIQFSRAVGDDALVRRYIDFYGLDFASEFLPVTHAMGAFASQEFRIACQYFGLPLDRQAGSVILVHGYYDHTGLYSHLIRLCLECGFNVLMFDLPGHGLSTGDPAGIRSFRQYTRVFRDCLAVAEQQSLNRPWHVIGQSTGGAIIIKYLLESADTSTSQLERILLLAPLLRPQNWLLGQISYFFLRGFKAQVKRDFAENSHDQEFLDFLRNSDPLQSQFLKTNWVAALREYLRDFADARTCERKIHIIQGAQDATVDWHYNLPRLQGKFPNASTCIIKSARHHLVNESPPIRAEVFSVVREILCTVPDA